VPRDETLLVVVGRGTSDPDANSNIAKVARMLWEGMGFAWCEVCYSGVTFPLVAPGLEHAVKLGYRRIIVFPYFLFTGVLVKRIYRITDEVAARHPAIEFLKAPYLNDHPLVLDAFAERVQEVLDGSPNMNCQLCKYREQVIGFESEIGLPQAGHHHHVEGIGTDGDHAHDGHGHDHRHDHDRHHRHDHDHHHVHRPPHPHAQHPHGPGRRNPERLE
jgi:sirohydrochlorin cobaltochelatase